MLKMPVPGDIFREIVPVSLRQMTSALCAMRDTMVAPRTHTPITPLEALKGGVLTSQRGSRHGSMLKMPVPGDIFREIVPVSLRQMTSALCAMRDTMVAPRTHTPITPLEALKGGVLTSQRGSRHGSMLKMPVPGDIFREIMPVSEANDLRTLRNEGHDGGAENAYTHHPAGSIERWGVDFAARQQAWIDAEDASAG